MTLCALCVGCDEPGHLAMLAGSDYSRHLIATLLSMHLWMQLPTKQKRSGVKSRGCELNRTTDAGVLKAGLPVG